MATIAIITTLDREFEEFRKLLIEQTDTPEKQLINGQEILKFEFDDSEIYLIQNTANGLVQASLTTANVIRELKPTYLILAGVCGGINIPIGDIIISRQIIDFSNQKQIDNESLYKSKSFKASSNLIRKAKGIKKSLLFNKLKDEQFKHSINEINIHVGSIASSDNVITSKNQIQSLIGSNRDILGVDQEGAGFAAAILDSNSDIEFIQIRSVADDLTNKKDNSIAFSSYIAAIFTIELIIKIINPTKKKTQKDASNKKDGEQVLNDDYKTGQGTYLKREFDLDRAYLNSDAYASALAEVFSESEGEFCFALLGHWGRGKTYLMHLTAQELQSKYECFWFSAWKYKTKPELWVYLFENIREKINEVNFFTRIPLIFQGKLMQYGIWPIILSILLLSLALIPFASVMIYLIGIVGLIGILKITKIFTLGKKKITGLKKFVFLNKFSEQLGLQALLGKELKYLILGIFNKSKFSRQNYTLGLIMYAVSVIILNLCLFWGLNEKNELDLLEHLFNISLYPRREYLILIAGIIDLFAIILPAWLLLTKNKKQKALLIVDDLDRVSPNEMLNIIESLKLFLEDDDINEILQITMIFEEQTLKAALKDKYSSIVKNEKDVERVLNENLQKLFIAQLNLPPLSITECIDYSSKLLEYDLIEESQQNSQTTTPASETNDHKTDKDTDSDTTGKQKNTKTQEETKSSELLTIDEKKAIISSLNFFTNSSDSTITLGPRTIQSLIIKYKLGRKLLESRGVYEIYPEIFTRLIAENLAKKSEDIVIPESLIQNSDIYKTVLSEII